jgi:hypothetical protein
MPQRTLLPVATRGDVPWTSLGTIEATGGTQFEFEILGTEWEDVGHQLELSFRKRSTGGEWEGFGSVSAHSGPGKSGVAGRTVTVSWDGGEMEVEGQVLVPVPFAWGLRVRY